MNSCYTQVRYSPTYISSVDMSMCKRSVQTKSRLRRAADQGCSTGAHAALPLVRFSAQAFTCIDCCQTFDRNSVQVRSFPPQWALGNEAQPPRNAAFSSRAYSSSPPVGAQAHVSCVTEHQKYALGATKPGGQGIVAVRCPWLHEAFCVAVPSPRNVPKVQMPMRNVESHRVSRCHAEECSRTAICRLSRGAVSRRGRGKL